MNCYKKTIKSPVLQANISLPDSTHQTIPLSTKKTKEKYQKITQGDSTNLTFTSTTHVSTNITSFNRIYDPSWIKNYTTNINNDQSFSVSLFSDTERRDLK